MSSNHSKVPARLLQYLPISFTLAAFLLMRCFPAHRIRIIVGFIIASFMLWLLLLLLNRKDHSTRGQMRSFFSLLSMDYKAAIPLVLFSVLAFPWIVQYLYDLQQEETLVYDKLLVVFFLFLLIATAVTIVNYLDARNRRSVQKYSVTQAPPRTKGLIVSLSLVREDKLAPAFPAVKNLCSPSQARDWLMQVKKIKSAAEIKDKEAAIRDLLRSESNLADFFVNLAGHPFYTPLIAILHHVDLLRSLHILLTPAARERFWPFFKEVFKYFYSDKQFQCKEVDIAQPMDVAHVMHIVDHIFKQCNLDGMDEGEITADITGGSASMSAGIILACVRSKRKVQYLRQDNFTLQAINIGSRDIPGLVDEFVEQWKMLRNRY